MGTLCYTATISLDGFVNDSDGDFQWSEPSPEVFRFPVERMAAVSTEVLGRRTYELMKYWEQDPSDGSWGPDEEEFARRWQALRVVVASSTLRESELTPTTAQLVPELNLSALREIVADAPGEVEIFGPTTAAEAIRAGMVDHYRFFIFPQTLGGGLRALPQGFRTPLRLAEHRLFSDGTMFLHYVAPES
ncbi:dihydrofolate reductase family protein [Brevibacterium gallinarum]|uniref:Dihydrofolate reductase family protein n=1 Tax=Brevibacterium gallinarum TaxID=2762220 RepID=A0ABR8WVP1_9MICO|nr:dihydrofolate reductase family protein [Brevibacterium gallinarum]MBD8021145.1 dihydrofolate reductase family protein [Brevibacterium gallinarum]